MEPVKPIAALHLFPEMLDALLKLLADLSKDDWARSTPCEGWSVHDVALHLLGDDVGMLSRRRDEFRPGATNVRTWDELVALINRLNAEWVQATRRISPHLLCDLLRLTGDQVNAYFRSLDPEAIGPPVSWAGPDPAPVWLDLAREYTERWHHQQHIRDAVGKPGLTEPRYLKPALDTFVRALPYAFRSAAAPNGAQVAFEIAGDAGGHWTLQREPGGWALFIGEAGHPSTTVSLPQEVAWRLFTKGMRPEQARAFAVISGDESLASCALNTVSLIA